MSTGARTSSAHRQVVLIYDGLCVLCQQSVRTIRALDWLKNVRTVDLHDSAYIETHYAHLDKPALMGAIHVITSDDRTLVGFFAVRYVARYLPLGWLVLPLLYLPGMNWLGPILYNWIAQRRYQINKFFGVDICEDGVCNVHPR